MTIIRTVHDKENPYVIINKKSLWDDRLSLEAVAVWARLISRPNDWQVSAIELSKSCHCSLKKIYAILKELMEFGYCIAGQKAEKGKKGFSKYEYFIFESPRTAEEIEEIKKSFMIRRFMVSIGTLSIGGHATNNYNTKEPKDLLQRKEDSSTSKKENSRAKTVERVIDKWRSEGRDPKLIQRVIDAYKQQIAGRILNIQKWMESVYLQKQEYASTDDLYSARLAFAHSRPANYIVKDDKVTYISGGHEKTYSLRGDDKFWKKYNL